MTSREERMGKNEALFRTINDKVQVAAERGGADLSLGERFLCECWVLDCEEMLMLTEAQYEMVRAHPDRFFVAPGHENAEIEQVVNDEGTFRIVVKFGPAREVVIEIAKDEET
ncbi:MAG TPA: hypothetical protein VNC78_09995 [Actinomycetota bacterium]|nr:hypothetical protein [Actinomycetota bacterium]